MFLGLSLKLLVATKNEFVVPAINSSTLNMLLTPSEYFILFKLLKKNLKRVVVGG